MIDAAGRRRPSRLSLLWIGVIFRWVTTQTPIDYGFVRSRWTCGTVVMLLKEDFGVQVGGTVQVDKDVGPRAETSRPARDVQQGGEV